MTTDRRPSPLLRVLYAVPILGWMLRDAVEGESDAPVWAVMNVVGLVALAVIVWGYPALIVAALIATALILGTIVIGTAGG
jgi:hypothetical protein